MAAVLRAERAGVGGDVHGAAGDAVFGSVEGGPGARWQRHVAGSVVVLAACRAGADGRGVLPHEPDRAAAGPVVRRLLVHGVPCHSAAGTAAGARAGVPHSRRPRPDVDRGRHPYPGPRSRRGCLLQELPVLGKRAGHRRCGDPPRGGGRPSGAWQHRRCQGLAQLRSGRALRGCDRARRRRLHQHRPGRNEKLSRACFESGSLA